MVLPPYFPIPYFPIPHSLFPYFPIPYFPTSLLLRFFHLFANRIENNQMSGVIENITYKPVFQTEAVEEVALRKDGVLHILEVLILKKERFHHFLADVSDEEQVDLRLRADECSREDDEIHDRELLQTGHNGTVCLDLLCKNAPKLVIEGKLLIYSVVLLPVPVAGTDESDAAEVLQFTANGVDLLVEETCQLTNEEFALRMHEERREELHPRLAAEQCFEDS